MNAVSRNVKEIVENTLRDFPGFSLFCQLILLLYLILNSSLHLTEWHLDSDCRLPESFHLVYVCFFFVQILLPVNPFYILRPEIQICIKRNENLAFLKKIMADANHFLLKLKTLIK